MEESYNVDPNTSQGTKTSSDTKNNSITTGDNEVQDGTDVVRPEEREKAYDKSDEQQEYLQDANNNTAVGNKNPVKDGKGLTM